MATRMTAAQKQRRIKVLQNRLNKINERLEGTLSGRNLASAQKTRDRLSKELGSLLTSKKQTPRGSDTIRGSLTEPEVRAAARAKGKPNPARVLGSPEFTSRSPDTFDTSRMPTLSKATSAPKPRPKTPTPKPRPKTSRPSGMLIGQPPKAGMMVPTRGSRETIDEYAKAFASPDAGKMYELSEKNRRKDMGALERAFDSIKLAGERATAERRKQGFNDYDMTEEEMIYDTLGGAKKGGRIKSAMKNKKTKGRKRAARRGFGVETRGS